MFFSDRQTQNSRQTLREAHLGKLTATYKSRTFLHPIVSESEAEAEFGTEVAEAELGLVWKVLKQRRSILYTALKASVGGSSDMTAWPDIALSGQRPPLLYREEPTAMVDFLSRAYCYQYWEDE